MSDASDVAQRQFAGILCQLGLSTVLCQFGIIDNRSADQTIKRFAGCLLRGCPESLLQVLANSEPNVDAATDIGESAFEMGNAVNAANNAVDLNKDVLSSQTDISAAAAFAARCLAFFCRSYSLFCERPASALLLEAQVFS
ncbi:hypothetical protein [Sinorhizobium medicae]